MAEAGEVLTASSIFEWELDVECFKNKKVGNALISPNFYTKSYGKHTNKWHLQLYPKGIRKEVAGYMSIFLYNLSDHKIPVTYSFKLSNQSSSVVQNINHLFKKGDGYGYSQFVKESYVLDPKNKVIQDNKITILCSIVIKKEVIASDKEIENSSNIQRLSLLDNFGNLLSNSDFSDITIKAGGRKFFLHKCILSAQSIIFRAMFTTIDSGDTYRSTLEIEDIEFEVLQEFFRFIYTGKVNQAEEIMCQLLDAAEKYCVEALKAVCENIMINNLFITNAIEYIRSAIKNNAKNLETKAIDYVSLHITEFIRRQDFDELVEDYPEVSIKITKI